MLLMTPEPVAWELRLALTAGHRYVNLASMEGVGRFNDPSESLSQRAKQKSAGGAMAALSSKDSTPFDVNPMWSSSTARSCEVGPLVDGRIVN